MGKKQKKSQFSRNFIIAAIIMFILLVIIQTPQPVACTEEAKICPDGSAVGRVPPNCEFAPCPSECPDIMCIWDSCPGKHVPGTDGCINCASPCGELCTCPEGYVQEGDVCNPECYYSIPKCLMPSFPCSTSCESDSDCVGAQCCHPTSCINKAYKGVCNLVCTAVCEGPLDCGAGTCGCVNNRCVVIPR